MSVGADLDHIALAAEHQSDLWPRYGGDLGGVWVGGGRTVGFASAQVRFGAGGDGDGMNMKLEALEPHEVEGNDFLRRFLDRSGPGPHHLTFKVPDIGATIAAARACGYEPVGIDLSQPQWMEAFLHPKQACGIVVQLAQAAGEWDEAVASPLPPSRVAEPAVLEEVVLLVADLGQGAALFGGLLGGTVADSPTALRWPGGGALRLAQPEPGGAEAAWLGSRPGRVDHLAFRVPDPAAVPDAVPVGEDRFEVPPEVNSGTRLILSPPT